MSDEQSIAPAERALMDFLQELCRSDPAAFRKGFELVHLAIREAMDDVAALIENEARVRLMGAESIREMLRAKPLQNGRVIPIPVGPAAGDLFREIEQEVRDIYSSDPEASNRLIGSISMWGARHRMEVQSGQENLQALDQVTAQKASGVGDLRH